MKVYAIIQARLSSTRLPKKILLDLHAGRNALECMVERLKRAKTLTNTAVATTLNPADDELVKFLEKINLPYFRGSENDVLDRYYQAAKHFEAEDGDVIVRLTSDCQLIDPVILDTVVGKFLEGGYDFVSNSLHPYTFPDGMDTEVFSFQNLERARKEAKFPSHREHVTFYFWQNPGIFKIYYHRNPEDLSKFRLTLDYPQDYELIKKVYADLYPNNPAFSMADIISYLRNHPDVFNLNQGIKQNAGWKPALEKDKEVK